MVHTSFSRLSHGVLNIADKSMTAIHDVDVLDRDAPEARPAH